VLDSCFVRITLRRSNENNWLAAHASIISLPVHLLPFIRQVLVLTRTCRLRLVLGIVCGFLAGIATLLLMGYVELVAKTLFPQPRAPSLLQPLLILPAQASLDAQSSAVLALLATAIGTITGTAGCLARIEPARRTALVRQQLNVRR